MPELPDLVIYLEQLRIRVLNEALQGIRLLTPFVLRSVAPPLERAVGRKVLELRRLGKRIVLCLEGDLFLVLHLMIAGRLHWYPTASVKAGRNGVAVFSFPSGNLLFTEAGSKKRAALHLVQGEAELRMLDRGGVEVLECDLLGFRAALRRENHTLKRALTDPHLFSGIGNAYSDEILHRAGLSPVALTQRLPDEAVERLFLASQAILREWVERLRKETGSAFPERVTAFRAGMAVHGRFQRPCPACGTAVQRIAHAENEANYCPRCQTGGKLLADRALSRLLKTDWPRTLEEMENRKATARDSIVLKESAGKR
ncbi:MAG TPA: DNA-formamidopyrimidine glycosylase family protein [Terriglobia bacterium]|jgi:formamidopyrimidine-DNA glycosylase|nr:DNA-formamidopyrimidine glycosylase family protein [Terriglobia bacterium]